MPVKDPEEMTPEELRDEITFRRRALSTPGFFYSEALAAVDAADRESIRAAFNYRLKTLETELDLREWPRDRGAEVLNVPHFQRRGFFYSRRILRGVSGGKESKKICGC